MSIICNEFKQKSYHNQDVIKKTTVEPYGQQAGFVAGRHLQNPDCAYFLKCRLCNLCLNSKPSKIRRDFW